MEESLFGKRRVKSKREPGAYSKISAFGLFECYGQVYTEIVPKRDFASCYQGESGYLFGRQFGWLARLLGYHRQRKYAAVQQIFVKGTNRDSL